MFNLFLIFTITGLTNFTIFIQFQVSQYHFDLINLLPFIV